MPSLYSCLRGFVRPFFDTMTTLLMIVLSRSCHVPGDKAPPIPVGYCALAAEVLKRYAPNKNEAIQYTVSCQTTCQMKLELNYLAILEPAVGTSADLGRQCLSQINASPFSGYLACCIDRIGEQPILCQRRFRGVSSYRIPV